MLEAIDGFISHLRDERRLSPNGPCLSCDLLKLAESAEERGYAELKDLSADMLRMHLAKLLATPSVESDYTLEPSPENRAPSGLAFEWQSRDQAEGINPAQLLDTPKRPQTLPRALDADAMLALGDTKNDTLREARYRAALFFSTDADCDTSEVATLKDQDVDTESES